LKTKAYILHQLISKLSKEEKRYISLGLQKDKLNDYHQIFTYLTKQKIYNEESLILTFPNNKFILNISVSKNRLQHKVMVCLLQFRKKKDIFHQLFEQIKMIPIYMEKGLMLHAIKEVKRLEKKCETQNINLLLVMALKYKAYLCFWMPKKIQEKTLISTTEKQKNTLEKLTQTEYLYQSQSLAHYLLNQPSRTATNRKIFKQVLKNNDGIFKQKDRLEDNFNYNLTYIKYYEFLNDHQGMYEYNKILFDLYLTYPQRKTTHKNNYFLSITTFMIACVQINDKKQFQELLSVSKNIPDFGEVNSFFAALFELQINLINYEYNKVKKNIPLLLNYYNLCNDAIADDIDKQRLYLSLAIAYHHLSDFKQSNLYINNLQILDIDVNNNYILSDILLVLNMFHSNEDPTLISNQIRSIKLHYKKEKITNVRDIFLLLNKLLDDKKHLPSIQQKIIDFNFKHIKLLNIEKVFNTL